MPEYKNTLHLPNDVVCGQGVCAIYDMNTDVDELENIGTNFNRPDYPFMDRLGNDWDCGHLLGKQLGGEAKPENLLPMTRNCNIYFCENMENKVRDVLENLKLIVSQLKMYNGFMTCLVKYEVNIVNGSNIEVNGLTIPGMFNARMSLIDHIGNEIPENVLSTSTYLSDNDLTRPLEMTFDVRR